VKILVLSNLYPPDVIGGYELGCKQAVDALRGRDHDVRVLTIAPRTPIHSEPHVLRQFKASEVWYSNRYVLGRSHAVTTRLMQAEATIISAFNVHVLTEAIADFEPDVIYAWMLVGVGGLGLMAAVQHLGIPWVWHLMDDVPVALCRLDGRVVDPLLREFARQLDGDYISCSRILVDEIEAGGIKLRPRVDVVTNWVVGEPLAPRSHFYQPGERLRIVNAGQMAPHKGVGVLIEAAALLREQGHEEFVIDLYGDVEDQQFPTLVRTLGLENHVLFQGARSHPELARLYPRYDLFAFPTWAREPFGFAPLEAAWTGCVPLISQACGIAEWLVHGVHCLKAERSPQAFAQAIAGVIDGSIDLEPLAHRAAAVVDRDFHIDAQVPKIEAVLTRALERPRKPGGSAADAYRMALLAEKLTKVLVQEAISA
jgi:glycosyltransferase involved in cell wall biosynthesis